MPKVSVVMPCYNVEKYIRQCIESLLHQTLSDFEIICVDDGSTDETVNIIKEYVAEDDRVILIEQKNQYAGVARNNGLEAASGEYVIFLDSDDFFAEEMLEKVSNAADENNAEVVVFGFKRYDEGKKDFFPKEELPKKEGIPEEAVFSALDATENIFKFTNPAPWTKLFRRSFVLETGLKFQALPNSNDFFFILAALSYAEKITVVREALTFYRVNMPNSTQGSKHKNPLCFLEAINALHENLKHRGVYEVFEKGFQAIALSSSKYNLYTATTDEARYTLLEEFSKEDNVINTFLNEPDDFYLDRTTAVNATLIHNAVMQYSLTKNTIQKADTKVLIPYRGEGDIKVSVIVPVYNTGSYLHDTLNSICTQTLRETEIICINDGSTDNSLDILKLWAEKDERISVSTHENSGLSCSRNSAMTLAKGEYIYFMDSDDLLESVALETLYNKAKEENLDVIYFDADVLYDYTELEESAPNFNYSRSRSYSEVYRGQDLFSIWYDKGEYLTSVCMAMYKRAYVAENNMKFHPGIIHEDNAFTFAGIINAERVSHIKASFFHRRIRANSIMTSKVSFKNAYGYYISYQDMMRAFSRAEDKISPENMSAVMSRIALNLYNAQTAFADMSKGELGKERGLGSDMRSFERLVVRQGKAYSERADLKKQNAKLKKDKKKLEKEGKKLKKDKKKLKADKKKSNERYNNLKSSMLRRFVISCWSEGYGYTFKRYTKSFLKKLSRKK